MRPEPKKQSDAEVRAAIGDFVFGSDEDIEQEVLAMSDEEVASELEEAGIDTDERFQELQQRLSKSVGRMRLAAAQQSLNQAKQEPPPIRNRGQENFDSLPPLNIPPGTLSQYPSSAGAAAFFRKHQGMDEEDKAAIQEDLAELQNDMEDEEDR